MGDYREFLANKSQSHGYHGKEIDRSGVHPMLFDFQKDLVFWSVRKGRAAVFADTGLGKALDSSTRVMTPNGYCEIGKLKTGCAVIGADGKPTTVLGVYPQGVRPAYKVTFSDDTSVICDLQHLWAVRNKTQAHRFNPFSVMTLQEIINRGLGGPGTNRQNRWFIPSLASPAEFAESDLPIHPYILGVLLGDGHVRHGQVSISSADPELIHRVAGLLPNGYQIIKKRYTKYDYGIVRSGKLAGKQGGHYKNQVLEILEELKIYGLLAHEKHIPACYKFSNVDTRLELLRGLFDTDGSIWMTSRAPVVEFSSSSKCLAEDVRFLVQSLGGKTKIKQRKTNRRDSYRLIPSFPRGINPFWLPRKANLYREPQKYLPRRSIRSVEQVSDRDMTCIKVAAEEGLFVIDNFIVTHNTFIQLEWARLIGEPTLIVAPLSVARQTIREAQKIGLDVQFSREGPAGQITITNYEMIDRFNPDDFGAVVLDESSILKGIAGKTRKKLTEAFSKTPYRLCCTATPAPNDIAEIANHAEFLGIMSRNDMLSTFFVHDNEWRLKRHAEKPFYKWLASWGMSIKKPSDLGYSDDGYILPKLSIHPVIVPTTVKPDGALFYNGLKGITERSDVRKKTLKDRIAKAVELRQETSGQWLMWCGLNEESNALAKMLPDSVNVQGSDSAESKAKAFEAFQDGKIGSLITKPKIAGFGMNFQNCHNLAFVGLSDSWEAYYQCIRRCWRFGQQNEVNVYIIISEAEAPIYENVMRKEKEARQMSESLIENIREFEKEEIRSGALDKYEYKEDEAAGDGWRLMLGDSVDRMKEIPNDSIGLSVFSPPFISLYTYTATERDIGNSKTEDEFFEHFRFIISDLLRVTRPGRNACVHVAQVPAMLVRDGYIGLKDFRGQTIKAFQDGGWIFHGDVTIDKDPQAQAIRTHSKALLFTQLKKDSSWLRPALADYILVFRKPGDNDAPIKPDLTNNEWIEWARPIWYGIKETGTLQFRQARNDKDERHICPLQLGTIERCIRLWSNKGETVFSPFTGIGSEGYEALRLDREFIGIELKEDYYNIAVKNLVSVSGRQQQTLFAEG